MPPRPPIGFVILSHRAPDQLHRLVRALNDLYDHPPIACHHDFGQVAIDRHDFPANVRFVDEWVATGWAKWSVVDAFLRALAVLYEDGGPDWFVLLSGADYPIRRGDAVLAELQNSGCDAFIDVHQIAAAPACASLTGAINPMLRHLDRAESLRTKWRFYLARQFWMPIIRSRPRWRLGRLTIRLPFAHRGPFRDGFTLWWGEHWFTANRRVANVLLQPTASHYALQRHLRWRTCPDEAYYQTVLCNTPGLTINRHNKRFTEWNGGGAHPMTLGVAEVPVMLASGMHFARKFDDDNAPRDLIDRALSSAVL